MTSSTVVKFKAKNITGILKESYSLIIMFVVFVCGILLGTLSLNSNNVVLSKAETLYLNFVSSRTDKTFLFQFFASVLDWLPFILAIFACGTCIVGIVLSPIFVCYKGFCYGAMAGYLYSLFSFKGIIFVLIFIIPSTLLFSFILFFIGEKSYRFSIKLAKSVMPGRIGENLYEPLTFYLKENFILFLFSLFVALIDALISTAFFDKINM